MSYETLIDCGRELDNDIKSGLIDETGLLPSGRTKLQLWRESPQFRVSCLTDEQLGQMIATTGVTDIFKHTMGIKEQEYRAAEALRFEESAND